MAEDEAVFCSNPICEVATKGVCADGIATESCPFFGKKEDGSQAGLNALIVGNAVRTLSGVPLPSGNALTPNDVDELLRCRPAKIIAIVGEAGSGKTTLLSSIYAEFLKGPFAGYSFCESRSLLGFEEVCHFSRIESGGEKPDTARTPISAGVQYFHLRLLADTQLLNCDILLSDRAGETYRAARNNSNNVRILDEVKKANCVALLLDGEKVAIDADRANAFNGIQQTLRAFMDGGILSTQSNVQIVVTKTDVWEKGDKESIKKTVGDFLSRIVNQFKGNLASLNIFEIAARDPTGQVALAHGVNELFQSWIDAEIPTIATNDPIELPLTGQFEKLLARQEEREEF